MGNLGNIKGVAFSEFLRWYSETRDVEQVRRIAEGLARTYPDVFDLSRPNYGILSSRWYPAEVVHALLDAIARGKSDADLDALALEGAEVIMGRTIRGIYKTMFRAVATPERYRKHIGRVWSLFYDSGRPVVTEEGPRQHRVRYEGWRSHHPLICRFNSSAGRPIYGAMGCEDVATRRVRCVSNGDAACETIISWR